MKIYDTFIFFNEFDILKLRLQELYKHVDYFVLVEANKTFSGKPKPFYFEENKDKFKKWSDKIIHVKIEDMPNLNPIGIFIQKLADKIYFNKNRKQRSKILNKVFPLRGIVIHFQIGRFNMHKFQKNATIRGLTDCDDSDIVMFSDTDEIPNPKKFPEMIELLKTEKKVGFIQREFNYYLNALAREKWLGTRATTFRNLKNIYKNKPYKVKTSLSDSRTIKKIFRTKGMPLIEGGGWHFSYMGSPEKIKEKFSSMAGSITISLDTKEIKRKINKNSVIHGSEKRLKFIEIDSSFPEALIKNIKEYRHLIK